MSNPPHWTNPNDPNDPHAQPTDAGQYPTFPHPGQPSQYPQFNQQAPPPPPYSQTGQFGVPQQSPTKPTYKQRFRAMSGRKKFGTIGCGTIIGTIMLCGLCAIIGNALPKAPQQPTTVASQQ